jgi:putative PEP-CTERM system histidine kinase
VNLDSVIDWGAALFSVALAIAIVLRPQRSLSHWLFFAGMIALGAESALAGISLAAFLPENVLRWQRLQLLVKSVLPVVWLSFSLTYSRGNYREFLHRWRFALMTAFLAPVALAAFAQGELSHAHMPEPGWEWQFEFGAAGKVFCIVFIVASVLILTNLEKTFRATVGALRWQIKFVVLALCVIFAAKIYLTSEALIYSNVNLLLSPMRASSLLIGCALIALSYVRTGLLEIAVYPSHTFLYGSVTILMSGVYLLTVGLLAQLAVAMGGSPIFPLEAFLILAGIVGLAILLLSDRLRQGIHRLISRHFKRPLYDYRTVWASFTERTAHATNQASLCDVTARLISTTFNVLSVTIWLADEKKDNLTLAASTSLPSSSPPSEHPQTRSDLHALLSDLRNNAYPFELGSVRAEWARVLRDYNPGSFRKGGTRVCVPMVAGEETLGVIVLADRVSGLPFTVEELDLLRCIGNHVAAGLLSLQLSEKLMQAREEEAFRAVSAFFAHDLKNAASILSLMLRNLPEHFEDPAFRADVLRGITRTVDHMNHLINRLSVLRQKLEITPVLSDLNEIVDNALNRWQAVPGIELLKNLQPLPKVLLDPGQIRNVVTNLVLNARDALGQHGQITIQTACQNGWAVFMVSDNGCGMAPEFLRHSLFRPFQTTKKDGTGIGMFQCKAIVEAHHGKIEVESAPGKGSSFRILLPLPPQT